MTAAPTLPLRRWARCARIRACLPLALTLLLAACGSSPPTQWLSLPMPMPMQPPVAPGVDAARLHQPYEVPPVLAVRRINIPEYLQSPSVRYRQSESVLGEWPDVRWADRLEVGLTDHLVMRLRRLLPGWTVCERQCPPEGSAMALQLDLAPLDYIRQARTLRAEARWTLVQRDRSAIPTPTGQLPPTRTLRGMRAFDLAVDADGASGQAHAVGKMLDLLAEDLAREALGWSGP